MHEEHEGPEMTPAATWSSQELSLATAPTYGPPSLSDEVAPDVYEAAPMAPVDAAPAGLNPLDAAPATDGPPADAEPTDPVLPPADELPAPRIVDPAELVAAHAHIADLQVKLAKLEEENRAFMQSLRHVAAAAEELLAEARTEAATMREAVERDIAYAHAELDARRAAIVTDSRREADRLLDESRATAHEIVVVARADAREAVHEERRRAADDLEMLAALRERIAEERNTLTQFHTQLSGRLRYLMHSMLEFADQNSAVDLGNPSTFASTVLTGPQAARSIALSGPVDLPDADRAAATRESTPEGDMHGDEAHLDRAFDAFFSSDDIDEDPSRRWILED